jgi:hypothetical protein
MLKSCRAGKCRDCQKKQHSLLHQPQPKAESQPQPTATPRRNNNVHSTSQQILLSAVVLVTYNSVGTPYHCRAILDSGS